MNCCDYDCSQGRDCPARNRPICKHCYGLGYDASGYTCTCARPAAVAKAGKRTHGPEPLPRSMWRTHLGSLARAMLLCLAVVMVSGVTVALVTRT